MKFKALAQLCLNHSLIWFLGHHQLQNPTTIIMNLRSWKLGNLARLSKYQFSHMLSQIFIEEWAPPEEEY